MTDSGWLDAIEARLRAATPGPWKASDFGHAGESEPSSIVVHQGDFDWRAIADGDLICATASWDYGEHCDAEFIAHAPEDIAALVAAVRERDAALARVEAYADKWSQRDNPWDRAFALAIRAALAGEGS